MTSHMKFRGNTAFVTASMHICTGVELGGGASSLHVFDSLYIGSISSMDLPPCMLVYLADVKGLGGVLGCLIEQGFG